MGILNVTPDSFSGDGIGGGPAAVARALAAAEQQVLDGADCVDVGGLSTRPGHQVIPADEEIGRVVPVIEALAKALPVPISVDTFRAAVARAALHAGARLINDVWGLRFDPDLADLAARRHVPLVVTHNRARTADPAYRERWPALPAPIPADADVVQVVRTELAAQLAAAAARGVPRWHLIADPGMGFGKSLAQHLQLMRHLDRIAALGYPLLFGASRKGFIGKLVGDLPPEERDAGSLAAAVLAAAHGAHMVRVHHVRSTVRALRVADAVLAAV
jgi:dihydropteroate synthase